MNIYQLYKKRNGICELCGEKILPYKLKYWKRKTPMSASSHHKIEKKDGGKATDENLMLLHLKCHRIFHGRKK